jgi:predicted dehydrogenase
MIKVGVIGYGYWGPNLARNVHENTNFEFVGIAEIDTKKQESAQRMYPNIKIYSDEDDLLNSSIDAVIIATNVKFHFKIAKKALTKKKHVLLEKPGTMNFKNLFQLHEIAKSNKLILMIDYTFLYNGAVQKLNEIIHSASFGNIMYIDSVRINLGIFQSEINVIWDLASHDIAIINFLLDKKPISVKAVGISHLNNSIENIAYISLNFEKNIFVHINCSWTSPVKIRQILIGGTKKMIVYNDIEPSDKLKVYDFDFQTLNANFKNDLLVDYRLGDISVPKFSTVEPLSLLISDFYLAICKKKVPVSSIQRALNVSSILEAAQKSIKSNGKEISIKYHES